MLKINQIHHGDCLELMHEIPDSSIDMVLADLPYGTTACHWDSIIPLESLWVHYKRVIKPRGAIVLTASQPFTTMLINAGGLNWFKYDWAWNKVNGANFFNLKNRPLKTKEDVLVFAGNANFTFNPQYIKRTKTSLQRDKPGGNPRNKNYGKTKVAQHYDAGDLDNIVKFKEDGIKHPIDIITFSITDLGIDRYNSPYKHPAQKPVALFAYLIRTYTNPDDIVLDNTAGSGTTAIAAIQTGRNWLCIKKDEAIYLTAKNRINKALGKTFEVAARAGQPNKAVASDHLPPAQLGLFTPPADTE